MPRAKPSTRVLNRIALTCGLVNIPLDLYTGNDDKYSGFSRHEWLPVEVTTGKGKKAEKKVELHSVGRAVVDKDDGYRVLSNEEKASVVKLVDTEYGKVYVEDHEIEKALNLDPDTLSVIAFQPLALLNQGHHYVPKKIMYIEPAKVRSGTKRTPGRNASNALATFLTGMREKGVMAVCELTTRGKPKPCVLLPDGALLEVWHTNALREQREIEEVEIPEQGRKMLYTLIDQYTVNEPADLDDKKSALIVAFAEEKAREGDFSLPEADTYVEPEPEDAGDFFAALQASLATAERATKKAAAKKAAS